MVLLVFVEFGVLLFCSVVLWMVIGFVVFIILFGICNFVVDECYYGVVMVIVLEVVVKLVVFLVVGVFVLWGVVDGLVDVLVCIDRIVIIFEGVGWVIKFDCWVVLIMLVGVVVLVLLCMF